MTTCPEFFRFAMTAIIAVCTMGFVNWIPGPLPGRRDPAGLEPPLTLVFDQKFAGVDRDGISNVWEGRVYGPVTGAVRMTLRHTAVAAAAAKPVWPVKARLTVSADMPRRSFVADLVGTIDWHRGSMRMTGLVTGGYLQGSDVYHDAKLLDFDAAGTLRITSPVAMR
jgi:hypothetical protein